MAGLMISDGAGGLSHMSYVNVTGGGVLQWCGMYGDNEPMPTWFKLVATYNPGSYNYTITGYYLNSQGQWVKPNNSYDNPNSIGLPQHLYAGAAVCASGDLGGSSLGLATATFANFSVADASVAAPAAPTGLSATPSGSSSVNLFWTAPAGTGNSYNIYRSTTPGGEGTTPYANGIIGTAWSDTSVNGGATYYYKVAAVNVGGAGSQSSEAGTTLAANLAPWTDVDIGAPGLAGCGYYNSGAATRTVSGGGTDIGGTSDQFNFLYRPNTGDAVAVAQITSVTTANVGSYAKSGLMFRNDTTPGSANVMLEIGVSTGGVDGIDLLWRSAAGGAESDAGLVANVPLPTATSPVWLEIVRSGTTFTGFYRTSGANWIQVGGALTVALTGTALAGIAATSNGGSALETATFRFQVGNAAAAIGAVIPTPRSASVSSTTIDFSAAVAGFDLSDLTLTRDGNAISLAGATFATTDNANWTLGNLAGLTGLPGLYVLSVSAATSGIVDGGGKSLASDASASWVMDAINATGGAATIRLAHHPGSGTLADVYLTGGSNPDYSVDLANLPQLLVNGQGSGDQLIVDYTGGSPLPGGGLAFNAGGQNTGDSVLVQGTAGTQVVTLAGSTVELGGLPIITTTGVKSFAFDLGEPGTNLQAIGGLLKSGPGTLVLSGTSAYSGATTVNNGMLQVASANALSTGTNLTINGGSVVLQSSLTHAIVLGGLSIATGSDAVGPQGGATALATVAQPVVNLASSMLPVAHEAAPPAVTVGSGRPLGPVVPAPTDALLLAVARGRVAARSQSGPPTMPAIAGPKQTAIQKAIDQAILHLMRPTG